MVIMKTLDVKYIFFFNFIFSFSKLKKQAFASNNMQYGHFTTLKSLKLLL